MSSGPADAGPVETVKAGLKGGLAWGAIGVASGRALQFVTMLVLARILAPEHFGALAVAQVIQAIAVNVTELGATAALARGDRDPHEIAPTILTLGLVTSAVITGGVVILAPTLANLMGDPGAVGVIQILAITILLSGCSGVPAAMVWRNYLQRPRAFIEVAGAALTLAAAIPMAQDGMGAYALVWSRVAGQVLSTIGYWIITPTRFRPGFDRAAAAYVLRLGLPLALANLVVFATLNLDYVIVGRQLGPAELGVYLLAFSLANLPSSLITAIIRTVAVPTFGRLHKAGLLDQAAPDVLALAAFLAMPISALLVALAGPIVQVLYGPTWQGAAAAMIGLGIFGAGRIVSEILADLCVGGGRTAGLFWVQMLWLTCLIPALLTGVSSSGVGGAGMAHAVVIWLAVLPVYFFLVGRVIKTSVKRMLAPSFVPLGAAAGAGTISWLASNWVTPPFLALACGCLAGIVLYLALTLRAARRTYSRLRLLSDTGPDQGERPEVEAAPPPTTTIAVQTTTRSPN
ncbi:O-antigen/teichoic acid export membrane protein [Arthrobacter ulcerisalmonis]|uniref:lipopolysaccharide biosynthesis protein n=1 Tax=Arthrobacter sp. B1I2 TaxID=3042263 RepID=UPI00278AB755|nr:MULTISPECIES: lipopolysaccharide biosynthesis protein [Arthrobacter]MDQ0662299.1 O-antigen/teichoic acid export membrane protein [Arthrobacter ulcerisalmonis]MDQ0730227.1 O-antigen/teichoic acid export membrane protein [Arthrobacter sp. B1I2]